ncbi:hypothetical protein [Succinimonas sp.]|uniref:hypothetical protein n=1 Tax=Succinimonas sp. TaxID=1936151 RepID=UPI00386A1404
MRSFPCYLILLMPLLINEAMASPQDCESKLKALSFESDANNYVGEAAAREKYVEDVYSTCFQKTLQGNKPLLSGIFLNNDSTFHVNIPVLTAIAAGDISYILYWTNTGAIGTGTNWYFDKLIYTRTPPNAYEKELHDSSHGVNTNILTYGPASWLWDPADEFKDKFKDKVVDWKDSQGNSVTESNGTVKINFNGHPEITITNSSRSYSATLKVSGKNIIDNERRLVFTTGTVSYTLTLDISDLSDAALQEERDIYIGTAVNAHKFNFTLNCHDAPGQNRCHRLNIGKVQFLNKYNDEGNEDEYFRISADTGSGCVPAKFQFKSCADKFCSPAESLSPYTGSVLLSGSSRTTGAQGQTWLEPDRQSRSVSAAIPEKTGSIYFCGNAESPSVSCTFDVPGCAISASTKAEQYINEPNNSLTISMNGEASTSSLTASSADITFSAGQNPLTVKTTQGSTTVSAGSTGKVTVPVTISNDGGTTLVPNFTITSPHFPDSNAKITGLAINYSSESNAGSGESAELVSVPLSPETGTNFDIKVLSLPYVICGNASDSDGNPVSELKTGADYRLKTYPAKCPDSGCPDSPTADSLKRVCVAANKVSLSGSSYPRQLSDAFSMIDPDKLNRWNQNPTDTAAGVFIANTSGSDSGAVFSMMQNCSDPITAGFITDAEGCLSIRNSAGWFSLASEKPYQDFSADKPTYFFSPVYAVYPSYMAVSEGWLHLSDDLTRKDVMTQDKADFENFAGIREIGDTCPAYYGQSLTFSGLITGIDSSGTPIDVIPDAYRNKNSNETPFKATLTKITRDGSGNLTAGKSIRTGQDYTLEFNSTLPAHWLKPEYQYYSAKHGYPFRFSFVTSRAELAVPEEIRLGGWLNFSYCLPDNDNFGNGCNGSREITGLPNIRSLLPSGSSLAASYDGTISDSDKFTFFTPASQAPELIYGRLVSQITQGETDVIYTPVTLQYYAGDGNWDISAKDSCTELHLRNPVFNHTENLIFSKTISNYTTSGVVAALSATEQIELDPVCHGENAATGCQGETSNFIDNATGRFNKGYLWLRGIQSNCTIRDNCALEYRLRSTGILGENALDYLYDGQTSNGGVSFKSHRTSVRIIDRKERYD